MKLGLPRVMDDIYRWNMSEMETEETFKDSMKISGLNN